MEEADYLADRIAIIADGALVALDTPEGLRSRAAHARVSWDGADGPHTVETDTPSAVLRDLLAEHAGEVPGLSIERPSLEDVYLSLIGEGGHALAEPVGSEGER